MGFVPHRRLQTAAALFVLACHGETIPVLDTDARSEPAAASDASAPWIVGREANLDVGGPLGDVSGVLAVPVATLLDSMGVAVHVAQGIDDPIKSADAMAYAGIRHFRDGGPASTVPKWIAMRQRSGVQGCIITDGNLAGTLDSARKLQAAGALFALEGPNEANNWPITYNGQTSDYNKTFLPVAQLQRDLYAAVKADAALANVPVFHASEAGGAEPDNVGLQYLTIPTGVQTLLPAGTRYADYANVHNYVCGHSGKLVSNVAWNASDPTLNGDWDGLYVEYGRTWHKQFAGYSNESLLTLPRVTTETGWVTSGSPTALNMEKQGRVLLDLYLSAFKRGFSYTFIYMLRDDPVQGRWGLFDTAYAPKRSGLYLHNFTTILADTARRAPGKLDYQLVTNSATVHDLLLQKADGTFMLVLWDERFDGSSDRVTVNFGNNRTRATVFDPTQGVNALYTVQNVRTLAIGLNDHPVIVQLPI